MPILTNDTLTLHISDNDGAITIVDRRREMAWQLDPACFGWAEQATDYWQHAHPYTLLTPFAPGQITHPAANALTITYPLPGGEISYTWTLLDDGLEVRLQVRAEGVGRISLPGAFRPEQGGMELLIPADQGLLVRDRGEAYDEGGVIDRDFMLPIVAYLGERGGLLAIEEGTRDRFLWHGRREDGLYGYFEAGPCAVEGWYERVVRIYPVERSITAAAKRYRRRLQERGRFVGWEQKIARKPMVEKLFGALIAFIGYNRGRQTDYIAGARALQAMGFDTVLYYPVRFNVMAPDFLMGGDPPINLTDAEIAGMKATGGIVAPWTWSYEALDTGDPAIRRTFRRDPAGQPVMHWRIDDFKWYCCCTGEQIDFVRRQYDGPMADMGWNHFDVTSGNGGWPCFDTAHPAHQGKPLTARGDRELIGQLLGPEVNGNRIISSEVFNEFCAQYYDLGSNKRVPASGEARDIPIPLTGLVFHDSTVHNWWEINVYNDLAGFAPDGDPAQVFSSGQPEKRAAMDALYGCPPLVFPFGRQYGWIDISIFKSFSFEVELSSAEVQQALRAALPVTRLHRKIGRQEMISFEFLTEDCAVQATRFADGTRVVANIDDEAREVAGIGVVPGNSWREMEG